MNKQSFLIIAILLNLFAGIIDVQAQQTLIHYWNFNDASNLLQPASSQIAGASIVYVEGTGTQNPKLEAGTAQNFDRLNARMGEEALTHLRFNDPVGGSITFSLPTTGYEDPVITYVTRRSTQSARAQIVSYTIDGINYTRFDSLVIADVPELKTLDFSAIAGADNNPEFKIKIEFVQVAGNGAGNNRFDNFAVDAISLSGGEDLNPPVATFYPANNAIDLPVDVLPRISFNEPVQLVSSVVLNEDAVILRKGDVDGEDVPFTITISEEGWIINPVSPFDHNSHYYLAIVPNTIEDLNGNAIENSPAVQFTTISVQTQFQAGDIVIIAYQMNAVPNTDRFAFLTLVDILPGTKIHVTDMKYTSNAQAQCAGGFVWTAPAEGVVAGTVVIIENDELTTNIGTLSGNGFGLSSGGDQIIMYTGSAAEPNYITALSSNNWVVSNTSCSGSLSMRPAPLTEGQTSLTLSTAAGNVAGNTANAYFNGSVSLDNFSPAQIRANVMDPANWIGTSSGSPAQNWPAWAFPGPPSVLSADVISQNQIRIIFNKDLQTESAENSANYTGISDLASAVSSNNSGIADTVWLTYSHPFSAGVPYTLVVNDIRDKKGQMMTEEFSFTFTFDPGAVVSFETNFYTISEDAGSVKILLNLDKAATGSLKLELKPAPFSTASAADHSFSTTTVSFNNESSKEITIDIVNDLDAENDEYFVLGIEEMNGLELSGFKYVTIYIKDNDKKAPVATKEIELELVTSFDPSPVGSTTEALTYDPDTKRFYVTSAIQNRFDIVDFSDPASPATLRSVDMNPYGGGVTGIAVKNGLVAVGAPGFTETDNGSVIFFDSDGDFVTSVTVGVLPDMVTFTPDGSKVLAANEGQPNNTYTIDPEGSVSVIDVSGGAASIDQSKVTTISFAPYNAMETTLTEAGVRKTFASSSLAQDLEPEYITISADSKKAWVVCQENNAMVEINLENNSLGDIWPLGTKDYSVTGNGADVSNNNGEILIANWPVKGFYHPDAIANYEVNGVPFVVTVNEGDEKEYSGLNERTTVGNSSVTLDPVKFPNAEVLKQSYNLGQFRITNINGDTDGDGDYDEIYAVGARSFSIFNAQTQQMVYDSGDDFDYITAQHPVFGSIFNANHENNNLKGRSNTKGCEPEALDVAVIEGNTYAFVGLERIGGIMVYNISDPFAPHFVDYANNRSVLGYSGDHGPEYVVFVSETESPDGSAYLLVSNEISGTVTVFKVKNNLVINGNNRELTKENGFSLHPNPTRGYVSFNKETDFEVFSLSGILMLKGTGNGLDVTGLSKGLYMIKTREGEIQKLMVE